MWCVEFPSLADFIPGPPVMLGEQWLDGGAHRYRVRAEFPPGAPFGAIQAAARRHGVSAEWNHVAGWMNLEGEGWRGFAAVRGAPSLALGEFIELLVEFPTEANHAQHAAIVLARQTEVFAPFVDLAYAYEARFESSSRLKFADGTAFGSIALGTPGFDTFLSQSIEAWLAERGFRAERLGDERVYTLGKLPPVVITHSEANPDTLRVDIAGLAAFESRPATITANGA